MMQNTHRMICVYIDTRTAHAVFSYKIIAAAMSRHSCR